ncbi:PREDICTED: Golgi SNAP receptor complex member 1 [Ceratosolen solmsi marchali]|uniref:Golgi SNAP receptor complex member 1 n=1 Tax=Ceratosolen solmsi marchali TaxID=326594 RepID=A0AAJ7DZS7_9HYME|nr:PREDICTED: Golgi SNAP receptor complex member 1 [Ceratosolen solmsi marchali]
MDSTLISRNWEDLRKEARHLENELDIKLVSFSKLGSSIKSNPINLNSIPLLDKEHVFANMASEIESSLTKLILLNEKMNEIHPNGAAMLHTMQRHKEILKDYKFEFSIVKNNFITQKNQENHLNKSLIDKSYNSVNGLNRRDMWLKENQYIQDSDTLINDQISIAMDTRDHLISQRHTFKRIQTRFHDLSNGFPAINTILQRINIRKRRDSVILGCLIICLIVLVILYSVR